MVSFGDIVIIICFHILCLMILCKAIICCNCSPEIMGVILPVIRLDSFCAGIWLILPVVVTTNIV